MIVIVAVVITMVVHVRPLSNSDALLDGVAVAMAVMLFGRLLHLVKNRKTLIRVARVEPHLVVRMLVSEVMWAMHKFRVDRILNHRVHLSNLQRLER